MARTVQSLTGNKVAELNIRTSTRVEFELIEVGELRLNSILGLNMHGSNIESGIGPEMKMELISELVLRLELEWKWEWE